MNLGKDHGIVTRQHARNSQEPGDVTERSEHRRALNPPAGVNRSNATAEVAVDCL